MEYDMSILAHSPFVVKPEATSNGSITTSLHPDATQIHRTLLKMFYAP